MDLEQIIKNANDSKINLPLSNKFNELTIIYEQLITKLILSSELTLYKFCDENNLKKNLNNNSSYLILNTFLQKIFLEICNKTNLDINSVLEIIIKITKSNNDIIISQIFYLINNFYNNLDRKNIPTDDIESYKKDFINKLKSFINNNNLEIIEIIKNNETYDNNDFTLDLLNQEI